MAFSLDEALGMSLEDEADESIHVGIDTRQVTIPESQQVFGVESDEDVEVKHIVIDGRYADGTDLSTFTFRVNYQNANGDKGTYLVTELKVNDSSIEFDWIIGRQVVAYKGTIAFIVCAYTIDSSSVIQNEWNSTLGKGTVLEGLEVSEFDFGDDIVRQLASILSDVNAAQASAKASADEAYKSKTEVVALGKEQQAAIEKKGKDTLATIPDDYTQVSNDVSQLKEDTAKLKDGKISKFYASSQGNTNLPDSDDGRIMDLKLYGKSSQQQYSGKNLWDMLHALTAGNVKIDGTKYVATAVTMQIDVTPESIPVRPIKIFSGKTYVLSIKTTVALEKGRYLCIEYVDGTRENFNYTNSNSIVFTAKKDISLIGLVIYQTSNGDTVWDVQLELGSTATDYEPYVGGIPSPNPEYPQEIKSVVKPVVEVCGKNLVGTLVPGIVDYSSGRFDGSFTRCVTSEYIPVQPGEKYTIQGGTDGDERWYYDADKKPLSHVPRGETVTITVPAGAAYMRISAMAENAQKFQVEKGSTVTDYQPYTETSATLPYTLNAIPVSSGGNVTIDGQQYIADYVDVERGKLVRCVERKRLFDLNVQRWGGLTETRADYQVNIEKYDTDPYTGRSIPCIISNLSKIGEYPSFDYSTTPNSGWAGYSKLAIYVSKDYDTVSKLKSYLGEDTEVVYKLKDSTETDLTADEIAAFKALVSYYPVTNVSATSDQLGGYTVFNYPISLANGWNYVKQQIGDTRDYLYGIDLMTAEAYVNSEYAAALAEIEV